MEYRYHIPNSIRIHHPQGRFANRPYKDRPDIDMEFLTGSQPYEMDEFVVMSNRFPSVVMDIFVAMPNLIHGIVILVGAPLAGARPPDETAAGVRRNGGTP